MSTNCNLFLKGTPEATENEREEDSSRARDESSSLSLVPGGPFDKTLHLVGEGKNDDGDEDCEEGDLENNDSGSVGTFPSDEHTNIDPCTEDIFNADNDSETRGDIKIQPTISHFDNEQMDDLGVNEVSPEDNIEELYFDGGGKLGKSSAGDFSTSQKYGKRKRASSCTSAGIRDVHRKKRSNSNSAMTKQQKETAREKDEIRSKSAKMREEKRFVAWLAKQPRTAPVEWSADAPAMKIEGDEGKKFINFAGRVVTQVKQLGLTNATETRLKNVLDNCFGGTYADYFEKSLMCCVKIKDGKRKVEYDQTHCKVCEVATNKLIKQAEHTCPYCHPCFHKTWKKDIVLLEHCKAQHGGSSEEEANDSEDSVRTPGSSELKLGGK